MLSIRELEYVEASRAIGAGHLRIMFDHVLPNCLSPLIVQATVVFGYAILSEAALSFLGFGAPSKASWGAILSDGRDWVFNAPWISIYPESPSPFSCWRQSGRGRPARHSRSEERVEP